MRCVRRLVADLHGSKCRTLAGVAHAYAAEKRHWLAVFATSANRVLIKHHRQVRNAAVAARYTSAVGLQARMWKLALVDAAETWDKYWQAIFVQVRQHVCQRPSFDEADRHYGNWLLCGYGQFFACLEKQTPEPPFALAYARRRKVARFIRQQVAACRGKAPQVKSARSFALDANCYSVFVQNNVQYLSLMTLERGKRLVVPLAGHVAIRGTLRVVLLPERLEIHTAHQLAARAPQDARGIEAIDLGYSEVCVDTHGTRYGVGLGGVATHISEVRHRKGQARNHLRAVQRKAHARGDSTKARNIHRFNLGKKHWRRREDRARGESQFFGVCRGAAHDGSEPD